MGMSLDKNPRLRFILHGDEAALGRADRQERAPRRPAEIRHADSVVAMDDKPSQVLRRAKGSSMSNAIEAVRTHEAEVAVSCGNTGALMVLSMMRLRKAPGVNRPAIACSGRPQIPAASTSCSTSAPTCAPMPRTCCNTR